MTNHDTPMFPVFTVGHSNATSEAFLALLKMHQIEAVADVRSSPYSEYSAQFNRETLEGALRLAGIQYFFVGDALGARRQEKSCYRDGVADYALIAQAGAFKKALARAEERARSMRIAIMCSEKDPLQCHRFLLICRQLKERGLDIQHILSDGSLEANAATEQRLLREQKLLDGDLFRSESEILNEAYDKQGAKSAYRRNDAQAS
jgi:uncharacterized protein (DUF488 family)